MRSGFPREEARDAASSRDAVPPREFAQDQITIVDHAGGGAVDGSVPGAGLRPGGRTSPSGVTGCPSFVKALATGLAGPGKNLSSDCENSATRCRRAATASWVEGKP